MTEFKTYIPKVKILNKTILGNDYNLGEYVRRASGNSSLTQAANTIALDLVPTKTTEYPGYIGLHSIPFWLKTIKKGDLITVGIETEHSWLYRIDSIRRVKRTSATGAEMGVRIMGRSMASVLLDDDITFAPELSVSPRAVELLGALRSSFLGFQGGLRGLTAEGSSHFLDGNPIAAIIWIFINMPSVNAKIFYADYNEKGELLSGQTDKVGKLFDFDLKMYEKDLLYNQELNQYTGKVWNYVMQCIDPMFYELYEETRVVDGKPRPTIFIRPKPFDRTTDRKDILDSRILELKLERNGSIEQGDFSIVKRTVPTGNDTSAEVYDVIVKGFNSNNDSYDATIERVSLFWDNENTADVSTGRNTFLTCVGNKLFHTVPEAEDYEHDLGSSTTNIVNFITMHARKDLGFQSSLAKLGYYYPLIDCYSVLQWGIRRMEAQTLMMHADAEEWTDKHSSQINVKPLKGAKVYPLETAVMLRERVFSWYRYNPHFLEGNQRVLGHDHYRKGDKIYFPHHLSDEGYSGGMYYYVTGVRWTFDLSQSGVNYSTHLELSRGENKQSLQEYRVNSGYDLYDKDIDREGDRQNPVIKVDAILADLGDGNNAGNDNKDKNSDNPILDTEIADTDPENPNLNGMAYKQGLTEKSLEAFKSKLGDEAVQTLIQTANKYSINPNVMVGLIDHESAGFNPNASSSTHCLGLGQFSRATARRMDAFADGVIKAGNPPNDVRRDPIKSIKAIGELLYKNGYKKNPVWAIMSYGNNEQTSYFGFIADAVNKYQPGVFTDNDKAWAKSNYGLLAKPKPKKK